MFKKLIITLIVIFFSCTLFIIGFRYVNSLDKFNEIYNSFYNIEKNKKEKFFKKKALIEKRLKNQYDTFRKIIFFTVLLIVLIIFLSFIYLIFKEVKSYQNHKYNNLLGETKKIKIPDNFNFLRQELREEIFFNFQEKFYSDYYPFEEYFKKDQKNLIKMPNKNISLQISNISKKVDKIVKGFCVFLGLKEDLFYYRRYKSFELYDNFLDFLDFDVGGNKIFAFFDNMENVRNLEKLFNFLEELNVLRFCILEKEYSFRKKFTNGYNFSNDFEVCYLEKIKNFQKIKEKIEDSLEIISKGILSIFFLSANKKNYLTEVIKEDYWTTIEEKQRKQLMHVLLNEYCFEKKNNWYNKETIEKIFNAAIFLLNTENNNLALGNVAASERRTESFDIFDYEKIETKNNILDDFLKLFFEHFFYQQGSFFIKNILDLSEEKYNNIYRQNFPELNFEKNKKKIPEKSLKNIDFLRSETNEFFRYLVTSSDNIFCHRNLLKELEGNNDEIRLQNLKKLRAFYKRNYADQKKTWPCLQQNMAEINFKSSFFNTKEAYQSYIERGFEKFHKSQENVKYIEKELNKIFEKFFKGESVRIADLYSKYVTLNKELAIQNFFFKTQSKNCCAFLTHKIKEIDQNVVLSFEESLSEKLSSGPLGEALEPIFKEKLKLYFNEHLRVFFLKSMIEKIINFFYHDEMLFFQEQASEYKKKKLRKIEMEFKKMSEKIKDFEKYEKNFEKYKKEYENSFKEYKENFEKEKNMDFAVINFYGDKTKKNLHSSARKILSFMRQKSFASIREILNEEDIKRFLKLLSEEEKDFFLLTN